MPSIKDHWFVWMSGLLLMNLLDGFLTACLVLVVLVILAAVITRLRNHSADAQIDDSDNVIDDAADSTETTEEFMKRVERLSRQELDKKETRSDDKPSD
jgi:uncharacterized membrane protein